MSVRIGQAGQLLLIDGDLDVHSVPDVRLAAVAALESGSGDLVLGLSDVGSVDTTGLGMLLELHRRAGRADRRLVLAGAGIRLRRLLVRSRLDRVLALDGPVLDVA